VKLILLSRWRKDKRYKVKKPVAGLSLQRVKKEFDALGSQFG
jgi:hypothetical protein